MSSRTEAAKYQVSPVFNHCVLKQGCPLSPLLQGDSKFFQLRQTPLAAPVYSFVEREMVLQNASAGKQP